jgi:peptide/nickel transport system permease protein
MSRSFVAHRIGLAALSLFIIATLNFWMFRILPGDPVAMIAREGALSESTAASLRAEFGLDKSLFHQYILYLKNVVTMDWGYSFTSRAPVTEVVGNALVNTLILVGAAYVLIVVFGILLGVLAGARRGSRVDSTIVTVSLGLWSLPTFWLGLVLILIFSVWIGGLPVAGMETYGAEYATPFDRAVDIGQHLILPTVTIALGSIAQFVLIMRASLVQVSRDAYMTTARAKGLSARRVLWRHGVPNAFLPTFTLTTLYLGILLAGTVQVEAVFSWPGIGGLIYNSVSTRDYPVLQFGFLVLAAFVVLANLLADLTYSKLDPRVGAL